MKQEFIKKLKEIDEDILLVFDNAGGLSVQFGEFKHYYDEMNQAVDDLIEFTKDQDTTSWEGHEEELTVEEDSETERNGGIQVWGRYDIIKAINDNEFETGWNNIQMFVESLEAKLIENV